ncbi:Oligosaccharyl transferase subunit OST3/OST6 family [Mycena chlorophos]|uniref:Oligosaccharyl transferase subunit OST3/OST6 family n=1 Tax=Mycena chlorophos TaxID=658473 RepID=A0A8H6SAX0_MYCCL|nr:Oligosaccharyl transferase subunit OST3/OST6 family [Mycena chlorophos]
MSLAPTHSQAISSATRWLFATACVSFTLIMSGGLMHARIHEVPLTGYTGGWVANGMSHMYGMEVRMVVPMYALLGLSFYMLASIAPKATTSRLRQRLFVYSWTVVMLLTYSVLVVFVKLKNWHYPFRLLL